MSENFETSSDPLLGPQLRRLRKLKSLSLKELAGRSGTSPSALHRYESGWDRFELGTLRRLAAALGARLVVTLDPVHRSIAVDKETAQGLTTSLRPLFWDVDLTRDHLEDNPDWVLRRVLQFGDWDQVHRARLYFGDDAVRSAADHRSMDARTRRLWQVILGPAVSGS